MIQLEVTDNTLVVTEQGIERLADLLERSVKPCLWAIQWKFNDFPNGISFHKSHKSARKFAQQQIDSVPVGPSRLVDVSDYIMALVREQDYCWTNLASFDEAAEYKETGCKHH